MVVGRLNKGDSKMKTNIKKFFANTVVRKYLSYWFKVQLLILLITTGHPINAVLLSTSVLACIGNVQLGLIILSGFVFDLSIS